jgi:hypothetical protein
MCIGGVKRFCVFWMGLLLLLSSFLLYLARSCIDCFLVVLAPPAAALLWGSPPEHLALRASICSAQNWGLLLHFFSNSCTQFFRASSQVL